MRLVLVPQLDLQYQFLERTSLHLWRLVLRYLAPIEVLGNHTKTDSVSHTSSTPLALLG